VLATDVCVFYPPNAMHAYEVHSRPAREKTAPEHAALADFKFV
jgi:hypothetical protein